MLVSTHCKCGGKWVKLKKDLLPMLSICEKCHESGPFWYYIQVLIDENKTEGDVKTLNIVD